MKDIHADARRHLLGDIYQQIDGAHIHLGHALDLIELGHDGSPLDFSVRASGACLKAAVGYIEELRKRDRAAAPKTSEKLAGVA